MKYVVSLAFAVVSYGQLLPQGTPAEVGMSRDRLDRIRAVQEKYIAQNQLAGGTALVARKGKVVYFETFGSMDRDSRKPMTKDAIFRIYSMTKPIIAVAALTLYEEGKFSLLDPVSKYIPEFTNMKVAIEPTDSAGRRLYSLVPAERAITVMDLMRHTSGMNNQGPKDEKGELIFPKLNIRSVALAEGIKRMPLRRSCISLERDSTTVRVRM